MVHTLWIAPLLLAILAFPRWPHSRQWGFVPCAGLTLIALVVLLLHALYVI